MPMVGFGVFQIPDPAVCQEFVEEAVGKAIKASGVPREELFITTKLWISDMSYEGAKKAFAESLAKLDLEYVDLYLLHQPVGDTFGAWRALKELYSEGKIKAISVSNFKNDQLANLSIFNKVTPAVNQVELHVFHQKQADPDYMASKGIQIESWGAFAEGKFDVFTNPVLREITGNYNVVSFPFPNQQIQNVCAKTSTSLISNYLLMIWQKLLQSTRIQPFMLTTTMRKQLKP